MIASIELRRVRHRQRAIVALPQMARLCSASNVFVPSGVLCDIEPNDLHRHLRLQVVVANQSLYYCDRGKYRSRARAVANARFDPSASGFVGLKQISRGAKPRWLVAAIKGGKKLDDFLIDKSARRSSWRRRPARRS